MEWRETEPCEAGALLAQMDLVTVQGETGQGETEAGAGAEEVWNLGKEVQQPRHERLDPVQLPHVDAGRAASKNLQETGGGHKRNQHAMHLLVK